ncbi:hypothetical protein, partial [Staphylococcus aureus]|uniref:hypothetical protein n=1 Tax=Staphylococcus aureus TaxID=1280 RepID=UPI00203DEBB7
EKEIYLARRSDAVIVVSQSDKDALERLVPGCNVFEVPLLRAVASRPPRMADTRDVVFVGGFGHPPNVDAVEWFLAEIWPLIRAASPRLR